MSGVPKSKYSDDFLVDYIDKRVRIVTDNYALARFAMMLIAESTVWTESKYEEKCNSENVRFMDLTARNVMTGKKAIISAKAYSEEMSLDYFIRHVERLHNKYRTAQQMEEFYYEPKGNN